MLSRLLTPRGLVHSAKLTGILAGACVVLVVPGLWLSRLVTGGLGETGSQFLLGLTLLAGLWSLLMAGVFVTFRAPYSWSPFETEPVQEWRKVAALGLVIGSLVWLEGLSWFLKRFLTLHGPLGEFVMAADWLGFPLRMPREEFTSQDLFTVLLLMMSAGTLARSWYAHYYEGFQPRLPAPLLGFMALGFGYLAMDEFFMIHELLGSNLSFLKGIPFVKQPDDLIIMGYLAFAGLVLLPYLSRLGKDRLSRWILFLALGTQALAAIADNFFPRVLWRIEESAEILAAGFYLLFSQRAGSRVALLAPVEASEAPQERTAKLTSIVRA